MFAQMVSQVRLSSTVFSDVAKFRPYHIVARLIFVELWYQCWKTLLLGHFDRVIGNEDSTVCEFLFVQRCEGGTNAAEWWAEETAAAARKFQVSVNTVDSFWVWAITMTIKTRVDGRIYKVSLQSLVACFDAVVLMYILIYPGLLRIWDGLWYLFWPVLPVVSLGKSFIQAIWYCSLIRQSESIKCCMHSWVNCK